MAKIKISTDSTSDIPAELRDALGIAVLPLTISLGEQEYRDGYDLAPQALYEYIESKDKLPTSSQVAPVLYTRLFEKTYEEGYDSLLHISLNGKGSGSYQGALLASRLFYDDHPEALGRFQIRILDSQTYSMAYGYAAVLAARAAREGKPFSEVLSIAEDWLRNARAMFVPLNLRCVKKSGRIPAAVAFVGDALGLKPVITFEGGEAKIVSKIRGENRVVPGLFDIVSKERRPGTPYMLVCGNNASQSEKLRTLCTEALGDAPEMEYPVGCIIAINTGPNMVGIIYRR